MAINSSMYAYRNPWQGSWTGSFARGQQIGERAEARQKQEKIKKIFAQNTRKNPDGSTSFNRADIVSQLAGVDPNMAMQFEQYENKKDLAKKSRKALILSEVKSPQDYAYAKQILMKEGLGTNDLPSEYSEDQLAQTLAQGYPDYISKKKIEAGLTEGGISAYQKERLAQAEERLRLQRENADRAERRFGHSVKVWEDKEDDERTQRAIPGYKRTGEVMQTPTEAMKLRDAASGAEQMLSKLDELRGLVNKRGSFQYFGNDAAKMDSLATEIQLLAKNQDMYNLGVLTGPDLMLLEKITASPSSFSSLLTKNSTRKAQIDQQIKSIQQKLQSRMKSAGYQKTGGSKSEMSSKDKQAMDWAKKNSSDPRAEKILSKLRSKYGGL